MAVNGGGHPGAPWWDKRLSLLFQKDNCITGAAVISLLSAPRIGTIVAAASKEGVLLQTNEATTAAEAALANSLHLEGLQFFNKSYFILSTVDRGTTTSKLKACMSTEEEEDRQQSISHSHYGRHAEPSSEPGGIILIQTAKLLLVVTYEAPVVPKGVLLVVEELADEVLKLQTKS